MPGLPYLHPDDNHMLTATISTTAAADADYLVANVANEDPSNPFKTTDTTAAVVADFGSAKVIGIVAVIHANWNAALPVVIDLDDNSGFSSPETFTLVIPPYQEDDHPGIAYYDFVAEGDGLKTYRYARVRNTSANSVDVTIGEIIIGPGWRELDADFRPSAVDDEAHPTIENESDMGGVQTVYSQGYRRRWVRGELLLTSKDGTAVTAEPIRRWNRAAKGRGRPFLIHPYLPIDEPWYVRFEKDQVPRARVYQADDGTFVHSYAIGFEECARGPVPEPIGNA